MNEARQRDPAPHQATEGRPDGVSAPRRASRLLLCGGLLLALLLATAVDRALYPRVVDFGLRSEHRLHDAYALFRVLGNGATWVLVGAVLLSIDLAAGGVRRFGRVSTLVLATLSSGLAANLLKLLIRRGRPRAHDGEFWFRPFTDEPFSSSGFGMPSGDATLACAGLFTLYRFYPAAWRLWVLLGSGCALGRMLAGAHFLSDVLVGATLGCACASWVYARLQERPGSTLPRDASSCAGLRAGPALVWSGVLLAGLLLVNASTAWQPAQSSDVPGLYFDVQQTDSKSYLRFDPAGTYKAAVLVAEEPSRMELSEGTWELSSDGLHLDGGPGLSLETSGKLVRWEDAQGVKVLQREGH